MEPKNSYPEYPETNTVDLAFLGEDGLTPEQWDLVVQHHQLAVNYAQSLDTGMAEDQIEYHANGILMECAKKFDPTRIGRNGEPKLEAYLQGTVAMKTKLRAVIEAHSGAIRTDWEARTAIGQVIAPTSLNTEDEGWDIADNHIGRDVVSSTRIDDDLASAILNHAVGLRGTQRELFTLITGYTGEEVIDVYEKYGQQPGVTLTLNELCEVLDLKVEYLCRRIRRLAPVLMDALAKAVESGEDFEMPAMFEFSTERRSLKAELVGAA